MLGELRRALAADGAAATALRSRGENLMAAGLISEAEAMKGGGQHASYGGPAGQMSDMGLTLGLLYHLTGERRYADKLREALLYYARYVRWRGQSFEQRDPPWHSELATANFAFGYATGLDALHGLLADADRKTIAEAMIRLAVLPTLDDWVLPGARIHSFDSMGHNWWGVCVAGAGLCALSLLGDEPRALEWIEAIDAGFVQWFNFQGNVLQNRVPPFERSGPSYEGVNYTNYAVSEYLHYRLAWQNLFPGRKAADHEPLLHLAEFLLQTLYPTSSGFFTVNFEDSPPEVDSTATVMLLIACGLGTPEAARYVHQVRSQRTDTLLPLLRLHPVPAPRAELPTASIYPRMGWAMLRSSWENDATLLAMKSGYTWNHAHADAGSFILYHRGRPLIVDSGTCRYNRREYSTYYRQSEAHNVILFEGAGQPKDDINLGCKFPGRMHSLVDGHGLKYVFADATGPMARWFDRNYRHWLWSGDVILIFDDVRAHTAGQMDWLLHFQGDYAAGPDGNIRLTNGPAEAVVRMLHPPHTLGEAIGLAEHDPDRKVPYLVLKPDGPAQSRQFVTAICLDPQNVPSFEITAEKDFIGVKIRTAKGVEEAWLNLRAISSAGSIGTRMGEWTTDAYLVHCKRAASDAPEIERYFVADGSYLRRGGRSILESLSRLTTCWSPGDPLEVFSDESSPTIQVAADRAPDRATWNGKAAPVVYDPGRQLVALKRPV